VLGIKICAIFEKSHQTYGIRRIRAALAAEGIVVGRRLIKAKMDQQPLSAIKRLPIPSMVCPLPPICSTDPAENPYILRLKKQRTLESFYDEVAFALSNT